MVACFCLWFNFIVIYFKFSKPGTKAGDYPDWAKEAVLNALKDAKLEYRDIKQACVGFCYGIVVEKINSLKSHINKPNMFEKGSQLLDNVHCMKLA